MKKFILAGAAIMAVAGAARAEFAPLYPSRPFDNVSLTLKGGAITPMRTISGSRVDNIRGLGGLEVRKQVSPTFGVGVEGEAMFNTSTINGRPSTHNIVDNVYVGLFGTINLNNLIAGYPGQPRPFEVELVGGAGMIHGFVPAAQGSDYNDVAVRTGVNFNINLGEARAWSINIKPTVLWNVNSQYSRFSTRSAGVELEAGVTYHFGNSNGTHSFVFFQPDYTAYNDQINELRGELAATSQAAAQLNAANGLLRQQLADCVNRPAPVVEKTVVQTKTDTNLESIRYVFFKIGSSTVTTDQKPNVVMIADYMKSHPEATVVIKGYASKDGNEDFNIKLAQRRAESVKDMLVKTYGVKADRIKAEGQGIGEMFKEESWNRVAICILSDD